MNTRNLIRAAVLKTNSVFPFNILNKIPYYFALKIFVRVFSSPNEIRSIYLRHGMSRKKWVPGISDIDITLIIDEHLSHEDEFNILKLFWNKFDRLKKIFPMLGEVDILNEREIEEWSKYTVRGYETSKWILLYGKKIIKRNYVVEANLLTIDSLNFALTNYLEYFLQRFYAEDSPDYIVQKELSRLASKIFRYTGVQFEENRNKSGNKSELLKTVINRLEAGVDKLNYKNEIVDPISLNVTTRESDLTHIPHIDGLSRYSNKIESFMITYTAQFIILKDDLEQEDIIDILNVIRASFKAEVVKPIILNFKIFEYMLRIYNPFLYSQLLDQRKVLMGEDSFLKVDQPDFSFYRKTLIDDLSNIFLFPRNKLVIQYKTIRQFIENNLNSIVNRMLFLKLYLEKASLEPMFNDSLTECRKNYQEQIQEVDFILINYKTLEAEKLSKDVFLLLRTLTGDIYSSLISPKILENSAGN